jgi:hypothetical protein
MARLTKATPILPEIEVPTTFLNFVQFTKGDRGWALHLFLAVGWLA